MSYDLATSVSPVTQTIPRFMARLWSINGPASAKFAVISTDPTDTTALQVSLKYGLQNDFVGLEWQSTDLFDHPLLAYEANRDYSNVTLAFHLQMDPYSTGVGEIGGPTFTAETWNTPGQVSSGVASEQFAALNSYLAGSNTGITGATNASPSVIATSSAHGRAVGDVVRISGVTGNTALNSVNSTTGWWVVCAVPTATTFTVADPATPTTPIDADGVTAGTIYMGIFRADVSIPFSTAFAANHAGIDRLYLSFVPAGYTVSPTSPGILSYPLTPTGATDASPSVVSTSTPHRLGEGQIVTIAGTTGNTAINGTWAVATVGPDTALTLKDVNTSAAVNGNGTFGGSPTMLAHTQLSSTVQITNLAVSGTGTLQLTQGSAGARPHNLRITLGYDDTYNLTPARLFWNWRQLGYRGKINLYTGAGHQFDLQLIYPSSTLFYQLNPGSGLNPAARTWFVDFYQRAKNQQSDVVVSLSFELPYQYANLAWAQRDVSLNAATTGYPLPTTLIDPCNEAGLSFLVEVFNAHLALQAAIGANLLFQVGEPWLWISTQGGAANPYTPVPFGASGYVGGNPVSGAGSAYLAPCVYGGSESGDYGMLYAIKNNLIVNPGAAPGADNFFIADPDNLNPGKNSLASYIEFNSNDLELYPLTTIPDNTHFPGVQNRGFYDWFRHNMGNATVSIRNGVKAIYPGAKACVLWFPPQVLGTKSFNAGLMAYLNYCFEAWAYSNGWDFVQLEAYSYYGNDYGSSDAPDPQRAIGAATVPLTVVSATNASPSLVTTGTAHGLATGRTVQVTGATGNTAIDGIWMIQYYDSTGFYLLNVETGVSVDGNGTFTGTATVAPYFWALPDGNEVSGVLGIFHEALGYPIDVLEFFAGTVPSQNVAETASQFASRAAADWLNIYVSMLYMFNQGLSQVYVWSDSQVREQGFVFQGAPPVANLQVTGFPTVPSGKVLQSASLCAVMLGDYADGSGTRYARQQFGAWDATNNCWKPAGEPDGVPLYIPGAPIGGLYPPVTQFKYSLNFADGTFESDEFNQQVIATTPGVWSFGQAQAATPIVNLPVGYQQYYIVEGYNAEGVQGTWDSTDRSGGNNFYVDLLPLIAPGQGLLVPNFDPLLTILPIAGSPIPLAKGIGWVYDTSVAPTIGGRLVLQNDYRLMIGEGLLLFAALE